MGTIKIELPIPTEANYKIETKETGEKFLREFEILIKRYKSEKESKKKNGTANLSENLQAAHDYLESLKESPESAEATRVADEMRKNWIRKYD